MPFEKDFGYLLPFLDRVSAAAASLPDEAARGELGALVDGEKQRWQRIQALLSGAQAASRGPSPAAGPKPLPSSVVYGELTVGSLRGRRL